MKRLFAFVVTMLLGASLAFGQAGGGSTGSKAPTTETGKKAHKGGKKGHKGGKKGKKGAGTDTTTPPPK
ncbi:MAG TPA: hypothetical protein VI685_01470 [Candidatus Angelobacter sp.]